jgi:O-antigen/teichoic acid export membrane protein
VVVAAWEGALVLRALAWPRLRVDARSTWQIFCASTTFLALDSVLAIRASLIVILLAALTNEATVGLFSAGRQLMVPMVMLFESVGVSVFPVLCKSVAADRNRLRRIAQLLIESLLAVALPVVLGLSFYTEAILLLVYGDRGFAASVPVLQIMAWILLIRALTHILGRLLLAAARERTNLQIVVLNTLFMFLAGLILINRFGLVGAAWTALLAALVNLVQHGVSASSLLAGLSWGRIVWKPLTAAVSMCVSLLLIERHDVMVAAAVGTGVYLVVLAGLAIWSAGGPAQFRLKLHALWSPAAAAEHRSVHVGGVIDG